MQLNMLFNISNFYLQRRLEQEIEEAEQRHEARKRKIIESSEKFQQDMKKVISMLDLRV